MKPEIENYITRNYYELLKITNKITNNNDWSGDLLNDVILQLYDKNEINLKSLDDNSIKYYIVCILKINWQSKTSPFFRKIRRESTMYYDLYEAKDYHDNDNTEEIHQMMDIVEMEWSEMDWFNKLIFEKYMVLGSLKKVAVDTTIPLTSIADYVRNTKKTIKENTLNRLKDE